MNKQEWLAERQKGIGGSEASAILGLNPYTNNVKLWQYKTGKNVVEVKDNEAMAYGRAAETPLITMFSLDYPDYKVTVPPPYTLQKNTVYPFILGTVDAELREDFNGCKGFLEIKTATVSSATQNQKWADKIPDNYYIQCLHYMLINPDYEFFFLKAQLKMPKDVFVTKHYYFSRDQRQVSDDKSMLLEKEKEFWDYVVRDVEPPLVLPPI